MRRGQLTTVEFRSGQLTVSCQAIAQTDGRAGQVVSFEETTTHRRLTAMVDGPGRAQVCGKTGSGT